MAAGAYHVVTLFAQLTRYLLAIAKFLGNVIRVHALIFVAAMHLSIIFGENIFINWEILTFWKFSMPPSWIFILSEFCTFRHDGCLFLSCMQNLIQIARIVAVFDVRLMTSRELTSSLVFNHMGISAWPCCTFVPNFVQILSSSTEMLLFFEIQYASAFRTFVTCVKARSHMTIGMTTCLQTRCDDRSSYRSQESNMFDSCDPTDDRRDVWTRLRPV